jgi:hypothetical protein
MRDLGKTILGASPSSLFFTLGLMSTALTGCPYNDTIIMDGNSKGQEGVLVDGVKDGRFKNDQIFSTSLGGSFSIGNFTHSSVEERGEIIAFGQGHPPIIVTPVPWTDKSDQISVPHANEYPISVYIWVVVAPTTFDSKRAEILEAGLRTAEIWTNENQGIRFSDFSARIIDVTSKKDTHGNKLSSKYIFNEENNLFSFDCDTLQQGKSERNVLLDFGYKENAINVYYLDHVSGIDGDGPNYGLSCDDDIRINNRTISSNVIALGSDSGEDLLAHELGHQFALSHVDDNITESEPCPANPSKPPYFCDTNVMYPFSSDRNYLTEGQTFRAIALDKSAINSTDSTRSGITRAVATCQSHTTATPDCPAIQIRIWNDGPLHSSER